MNTINVNRVKSKEESKYIDEIQSFSQSTIIYHSSLEQMLIFISAVALNLETVFSVII